MKRVDFKTPPKSGPLYRRALFRRRDGSSKPDIPRIEAHIHPMVPSPREVDGYRRVTQDATSGFLPICFPHVLASPLHAAILAQPEFPYPVLGLIHLANRITQHRRIVDTEAIDITCWVEGMEEVDKGVTFELMTEVKVGEELVWDSQSTLIRLLKQASGKTGRKKRPAFEPGEAPGASHSVIWRVPEDQGRKYAKVSGDFNPIHLYPLTAKLFGFKRPIVHGMWSLARCVAELPLAEQEAPMTLSARFKRPVFLPGRVLFTAHPTPEGHRLKLTSHDGRIPHLEGTYEGVKG